MESTDESTRRQALDNYIEKQKIRAKAFEWWDNLSAAQKEWCCIKYNNSSMWAILTGREVEEIWKSEHRFYEQSFNWWRNLDHNTQEYFKKKYNKKVFGGYNDQVVLNEIEEIWKKETLDTIEEKANQLKDDEYLDIQTLDIVKASDLKINQKQFKEFNPELFKSYISKFSDEDKMKAFQLIFDSINDDKKHSSLLKSGIIDWYKRNCY